MSKCSVSGCTNEAKHWRIALDSPNSTALNGYLCDVHYEKFLDVLRVVGLYALRWTE